LALQFSERWGRPGTYANVIESNKIDYVFLSSAPWGQISAGDVWRKGVWRDKKGSLFPHYDKNDKPSPGRVRSRRHLGRDQSMMPLIAGAEPAPRAAGYRGLGEEDYVRLWPSDDTTPFA
jgi:hypothetical protein